jgi:hypothetical protein
MIHDTFYVCHLIVPDYEVVGPSLSDANGNFESYELLPKIRRRLRRPIEEILTQRWHYSIPVRNDLLLLKVMPRAMLATPTVTIETHHSNGSVTNDTLPMMSHCVGHVVSHPGSLVAISNHDGLVSKRL